MLHPSRSIVVALCFFTAAAFAIPACSSDSPDVAAGDGGPPGTTTPEGGVVTGNGIKDGTETDVDCGGGAPGVPRCADGKMCLKPADCATGFCSPGGTCVTVSATDGLKNGDETDVDCGGTTAPRCASGKACIERADCDSKVCTDNVCGVATSTDRIQNGDETDVDCGGASTGAPRCVLDQKCNLGTDCGSGICGADKLCDAPLGTDGIKNGDESDVDCGGTTTGALKCGTDKNCNSPADCADKVCTGGKCKAPAYDDGILNGTETDLDCGGDGTVLHGCDTGKTCKVHGDCKSNGCDFDMKCAPRASCTAKDGGSTCLRNGTTAESCCKSIAVPAGKIGTRNVPAFTVDKYVATAGRMRAFLTRVNGNVRAYIEANKPAWWDDRWTPWLPQSFNGHVDNDYAKPVHTTKVMGWPQGKYTLSGTTVNTTLPAEELTRQDINIASAYAQVAGAVIYDQGSQGCAFGTGGYAHPTYLVPKADAVAIYGDAYDRWIPQSALDARPLNCATWPVMAALCAFDGGNLVSSDQFNYIYDDDGFNAATSTTVKSTYPWGSPPELTCSSGLIKGGVCCKTNETNTDGTACKQGGGTWTASAGYNAATNPHPGGYAELAGLWTKVGPGRTGFNSNPCPACADDWVNWQFNWQDPTLDPYAPGNTVAEQNRRARDQSYFISPPGTFPKGASRKMSADEGDRVQDIAGLVFNAITQSKTATANKALITFGDDAPGNDFAASVPSISSGGTGSWEGHAVGSGGGYPLPSKYGKMGMRCAY